MTNLKLEKLLAYLNQFEQVTIAVSGGIDSMLLTYIAHRLSKANVTAVHAYSPAVPESAMLRIKSYAQRYQWRLKIIDANEFKDTNYLNNPQNRCYYCKRNLYKRIKEGAKDVVFSGTNIDDLSDVRPGLEAAKESSVKHPYVEAGITKKDIYAIAKHFSLNQLYSLPAQPCLASRVETGIRIEKEDMHFIDEVEQQLRDLFPSSKNVRCRISQLGIVVELDNIPKGDTFNHVMDKLTHYCADKGRVFNGMRHYQKGAAFLNGVTHG